MSTAPVLRGAVSAMHLSPEERAALVALLPSSPELVPENALPHEELERYAKASFLSLGDRARDLLVERARALVRSRDAASARELAAAIVRPLLKGTPLAGRLAARDDGTPVLGRYRIEQLVGRTRTGGIHRARGPEGTVIVYSLPIFSKDDDLEREVDAAFQRQGAPLPLRQAMLGFERRGQHVLIVVEELGGRPLSELPPLPEKTAIGLVLPLARTLAPGTRWFELDPATMHVRHDGQLRIPISLALLERAKPGAAGMGEGMSAALAYWPPEVLDNALAGNERSLVYTIAGLLGWLVSKKPPFEARTSRTFILKILTEEPDLSGMPVSPGLRALLARCFRKAPAERPAPAELVRELETLCR